MRLRLAGRTLLEIRKRLPGVSFYEGLRVENFDSIIDAVRDCCKENTAGETPNTALKVGQMLHHLIKRKIIVAFTEKNKDEIVDSQALKRLFKGTDENEMFFNIPTYLG